MLVLPMEAQPCGTNSHLASEGSLHMHAKKASVLCSLNTEQPHLDGDILVALRDHHAHRRRLKVCILKSVIHRPQRVLNLRTLPCPGL